MRSKVPTFRERILAAGAPDNAAVLQRFFKTDGCSVRWASAIPPGLLSFLDRHAAAMPRTMLRYAIERLPEPRHRQYLAMKHRQAASCKPHVQESSCP